MRVLVACEESGVVRDAFLERGHDAVSCDLMDSRSEGSHIKDDVVNVINKSPLFDIIIAHPPCDFLANSGVRWLYEKPGRWEKMEQAASFFRFLLEAPARIGKAVENPVMHKYAVEIVGRKHDQTIQPYEFGHMECKRTCLWLDRLPLLAETKNVKRETFELPYNERCKVHYARPGPDRSRDRSVTYQGIAEAMADQWGSLADFEDLL